ncbi:unnamed protein product [Candidula unifasciata]|uniref:C2H2-type domain-containing protein n=1 Tax=Candidula unifasciata TaxID=100452 RepID=A0A8S3YKL9_9EUPU|nr:unnamed protein product [Candidula unifasciata]
MDSDLHTVIPLEHHASNSSQQSHSLATGLENALDQCSSDSSEIESKSVICHMNPELVATNSNKLNSLMPKNFLNIIPKPRSSIFSLQIADGTHVQSESKLLSLLPTRIVVSDLDKTAQEIALMAPVSSSAVIGNIFQQFQVSQSSDDSEAESKMSHSCAEQDHAPHTSFSIEPMQVTVPQLASGSAHSTWCNGIGASEFIASHTTSDEIDKEQDIIKKTVVEAFVKMVVCRKVTVQKVHLKTGEILDTKVKTEEEEPVILGVDCVETTEDLISSSVAEIAIADNCSTDAVPSKWGTSPDGGLKFLSAVSESRQKIGKSIIKEKGFVSSTQKGVLPRLPESEENLSAQEQVFNEAFVVESTSNNDSLHIKAEPVTDRESDWNEEFNDSSQDYIPNISRTNYQKSSTSLRKMSRGKLHDSSYSHVMQPCSGESIMNALDPDVLVLCQKKRGRKRKWDNALGMASNLKMCQFCNINFSSVQACARHMKKGYCISSVFCFICSKAFQNEQLLENHLMIHGSEVKSEAFECSDCNRFYRTHAGYVKHFRMGTCSKRDGFEDGRTGEFNCDLCESRFSTEGYLKLHRYKVHENPKDTHACSDCGKRFYSTLGYNKHRQGRPCTEPLRCHICGKSYSSKAKESFKIHMKHHKTEVSGITFQCDECDRSYMTQVALNKHKLSHTGVKPYKCNVCGKDFSMRYMVKDHARMHTGERPFLCGLCGGAFSNKGHLGRHLRSHENGTLMKRGRPKKIRDPGELKMIEFGQTLHSFDGQTIQVVDGQIFESQTSGTPVIIQANNNTIIIAEGWPNTSTASAITLPSCHSLENISANIHCSNV